MGPGDKSPAGCGAGPHGLRNVLNKEELNYRVTSALRVKETSRKVFCFGEIALLHFGLVSFRFLPCGKENMSHCATSALRALKHRAKLLCLGEARDNFGKFGFCLVAKKTCAIVRPPLCALKHRAKPLVSW